MRLIGNSSIHRDPEGTKFGQGNLARLICDWRLVTCETAAEIETAGYFNPIAGQMEVGASILASLDMKGTPQLRKYIVTGVQGTVTIAPLAVARSIAA